MGGVTAKSVMELISNISAFYTGQSRLSVYQGQRQHLLIVFSLMPSEEIPLCFNSSAVLSCSARSVFVGRVAAAGSGRDGRDSRTP